MSRLGGLRAFVRRVIRAEGGAVAIIIGLAAIPVVMAAGMALDFVHASSIRARLQNALDAAALAAASSSDLNDKKRLAIAQAVFAANWQSAMTKGIDASPEF